MTRRFRLLQRVQEGEWERRGLCTGLVGNFRGGHPSRWQVTRCWDGSDLPERFGGAWGEDGGISLQDGRWRQLPHRGQWPLSWGTHTHTKVAAPWGGWGDNTGT